MQSADALSTNIFVRNLKRFSFSAGDSGNLKADRRSLSDLDKFGRSPDGLMIFRFRSFTPKLLSTKL